MSKKPKGLKIDRSGDDWIFSWKKGGDYKDQDLEYKLDGAKKWTAISGKKIGKNTTSKTLKNKIVNTIQFRVRGEIKKNTSWAESSVFTVIEPYAPSGSAELTQPFSTKFSYTVPYSTTDNRPFVNSTWQTKLFPGWNAGAPSDGYWKGADSKTDDSTFELTIDEAGFSGESYSYTRWFRARSNGWNGKVSAWTYLKHVYATPYRAGNISAQYYPLGTKDGYSVSVNWETAVDYAHPVDAVTVQYLVSAPETTVETVVAKDGSKSVVMTLSCPNSDQGWQSLTDVNGTGGKRTISFTVSSELKDDECIFVRVNNKHDALTTYSLPKLVTGGIGKLAAPSIVSITPGGVDNLYTVTVDRKTTVNNAFIAIYCRTESDQNPDAPIGIIPANRTSVDCVAPNTGEEMSFGVKAFVANYSPAAATSETEPTYYTISNISGLSCYMESETNWDGGAVPLPPTKISVSKVNDTTAQISWEWSWRSANSAEITWADHEDAWESTSEPSKYVVNSTNASRWNVAGLSVGTWYFRIRLMKTDGDSTTYGTYSEIFPLKLASSPDTPSLVLSDTIVSKSGIVTCYWAYVSTDGTPQMYAEVCEVLYEFTQVVSPTGNPFSNGYYELVDGKYKQSFDVEVVSGKTYYVPSGEMTYGDRLGSTNTAQHIDLNMKEMVEQYGWGPNETHHLAVRVTAGSGESSEDWSAPVSMTIAEEIVATIIETSLVDETETIVDDDTEITLNYKALKVLPFTARATGAGINGTTTYIIERAAPYFMERPDETTNDGFEGETLFIGDQIGEEEIEITQESLMGYLDDGATYRLIAIVHDPYGQSKEDSIEFKVKWEHQAIMPSATIEADNQNHITKITPILPESGYLEGDSIDIYRLSADPPELIYKGAAFGTTYVDPYPTLGDFGGHRIVYRTFNGDYITANNEVAWTDYEVAENPEYKHTLFGVVIDFDDEQVVLPYNVSLNNGWSKDFTKTKYLGGSVQGDWNPAVERESSANVTIPVIIEPETMEAVRRLAVYPGVCHVRTPDGSSYAANVEVKDDREEKWIPRLSKVSLTISKVDGDGTFDGMTLAAWEEEQ